jgi:hypothetical protein
MDLKEIRTVVENDGAKPKEVARALQDLDDFFTQSEEQLDDHTRVECIDLRAKLMTRITKVTKTPNSVKAKPKPKAKAKAKPRTRRKVEQAPEPEPAKVDVPVGKPEDIQAEEKPASEDEADISPYVGGIFLLVCAGFAIWAWRHR